MLFKHILGPILGLLLVFSFGHADKLSTCFTCDSATDLACRARLTEKFSTQCSSNEGCFARVNDAGELERGCLSELSADLKFALTAGFDSSCKTCEGDDCNGFNFEDEPSDEKHSCYVCSGAGCEDPDVQECDLKQKNDKCYYLFNTEKSLVGLGCSSDYKPNEITDLIGDRQIFLCDGKNCNSFENLPAPHECTVCNSKTDAKCATNPTATTKTQRCNSVPFTGCFTRTTFDGHTERGCLNSLDNQFLECFLNNGTSCKSCDGDRCNEEIFPQNRLRCHQCNSKDNTACENSPKSASVCPLHKALDQCVTTYGEDHETTIRGCKSTINCDPKTNLFCQACSGNNCNTANFKSRIEEFFGIFQALPLNCYHCEGDACQTSKGVLRKCEGVTVQDCLLVMDETGKVIRRGCQDVVEASHGDVCAKNPANCPKCKSNACNVGVNKSDFIDCIVCDSKTDPNCVFNVADVTTKRSCHKQCLTALYPTSENKDANYEVIRTCFDDMEEEDRENCPNEKCKTCSSELCNKVNIPEERLSCNHCKGDDCDAPTPKKCSTYSNDDKCFMRFDKQNSVVEMGCKSIFEPDYVKNNIANIYLCDGDNCNTYEDLPEGSHCTVCNSAEDPNCATNAALIKTTRRCANIPYKQCFSKINEDGHTERGCIRQLDEESFNGCIFGTDPLCKLCIGTECNNKVFPEDRAVCHRCNSTNPLCEKAETSPEACPIYTPGEACVSKYEEENKYTIRGCESELVCGPNDSRLTCKKCVGTNCNSHNMEEFSIGKLDQWLELPLNCYTCEGVECQKKDSVGVLRKCENGKYQSCSSIFAANGTVISRGCSYSVDGRFDEHCLANPDNCFNCKSSGCNSAMKLDDYVDCVHCDSSKDSECTFNANSIKRTRKCHKSCLTALQPFSSSPNSIQHVIRGCLDDKDIYDAEDCVSGKDKSCTACTGNRCNINRLPEKHFSCFHCDGEDCKQAEIRECKNHREKDQCFFLFKLNEETNLNKLTKLGCASSYDDEEADSLIWNKELHLCDGENCNKLDNLPSSQTCLQCNSKSNPECATKAVGKSVTCDQTPFTDCYTRIHYGGHTERGCLSSLMETGFFDCYKNNGLCSTCQGENCNNKIIPENRLECHHCNSKNDESCHSTTGIETISMCTRYVEGDTCVTTYDSGVTRRGCASDIVCPGNRNSKNCRPCTGENCNTVNLQRQVPIFPGLWQELPLNCYTCKGSDCENSRGVLRKCESDNQEECVTVIGDMGKVISRGCSATVDEEYGSYCDTNPTKCVNCFSSGCNTATSLADFNECVLCDGAKDLNCVFQPDLVKTKRQCHGPCLTALYPRSVDSDPAYEVIRSCLNDIEFDDQLECKGGNCLQCIGANCNTQLIPEKRFRCMSCIGPDCMEPESIECKSYKKNDQCFIHLSQNNEVIRMGCRSSLDDKVFQYMKSKSLLCEGENCNTFESIPAASTCVACNSATDVNCAINPLAVHTEKKCVDLPHTSCATIIRLDGTTERGCLVDLQPEEFESCLEGDDFCEVCIGDHCNLKKFPEDRLSCHVCDSTVDADCFINPSRSKYCAIHQEYGSCVSHVVGDHIKRGCSSELICDSNDRKNCRYCNGNDCNTHDLLRNDIGEIGLWQDLPLNCMTCIGEQCENSKSTGVLRKCEGNSRSTCMTIFGINGKVQERGCSDLVEKKNELYCENNPEKCFHCKSSGCNVAHSMSKYVDCLFCSSVTNGDCVNDPKSVGRTRKCLDKCFVGMYPRSTESNATFELVRSCLDDLEYDDRLECQAGNLGHCKACRGSKCNTANIPEKRLSCMSCENGDCEFPHPRLCAAHKADDLCFMLFDEQNSVAQMGCKSDLADHEAEQLFKKMHLCVGDNCNIYEGLPKANFCAFCNSTTNPDCATNPEKLKSIGRCGTHPYTQCYMQIEEGITKRGCLSHLPDETFKACLKGDSSCQACSGHNCNQVVFPENRLSCEQCDSSVDPNCEADTGSNGVCPIYVEKDTCVTTLVNGVTHRGCSAQLSCDSNDLLNCRYCNEPGCNVHNLVTSGIVGLPGLWQDLPLNCKSCKGENCKTSKGVLRKCEGEKQQNCVTVFGEDNTVVERGCSGTLEISQERYCALNPYKCPQCKSSGCNNATALSEYVDCLFCDSQTNPDCVLNTNKVSLTRKCQGSCMSALYPRNSSSSDPSYELIRTCLDDKELDDREICDSDDKTCSSCKGRKCNSNDLIEKRNSCFHCEGKDCSKPVAQKCVAHKDQDTCFTAFNDKNVLIERGCTSKFDAAEVNDLILSRSHRLCEGDNCNALETAPTKTQCKVCHSDDDENCATNPDAVRKSVTCGNLPYSDCFTKVNSDGSTERGCLNNLVYDEFADCLSGNSSTCSICSEDHCNSRIFPDNRQTCIRCSTSDHNENCPPSVCPTYNSEDFCVSFLDNDVLHRGCGSELTCNASDNKNCRICDSNNCNTDKLLESSIGEPGHWQDLPLNCFHCEGDACKLSKGVLRKCENNNLQTCKSVFGEVGQVVWRGCSDKIDVTHVEYCDNNPEKCPGCKSNACNTITNLESLVDCLFCNSETNRDCVFKPEGITRSRKCHGGCLSGLYPLTSEQNPAFGLERTCLNDLDDDDQIETIAGRREYVKHCIGAKCNKEIIPEKRLSCLHCLNGSCDTPVAKECVKYRANDKCYLLFDQTSSVSSMGCQSEFTWANISDLVTNKTVHFCEGDNCNTFDSLPLPKVCTLCNSKTDALCATSPTEVNGATRCSKIPYTQCYSRLLTDGHTERGCLSSLEGDEFNACLNGDSELCKVCEGDRCNNKPLPDKRLSCHRCNSLIDPTCDSTPNHLQQCVKHFADNSCVVQYNNGITYRGCAYEFPCDTKDPKSCRVCEGDGCNVVDLASKHDGNYGKWQELPLTCLECTGEECESPTEKTKTCANNNEQDCLVVFNTEGKVVRRGCAIDVDTDYETYCAQNAGKCLACKSNKCNIANSLTDYTECISCDSATDSNCVLTPTAGPVKTRQCHGSCMSAMYPATSGDKPSYEVIRTCLNDKESKDAEVCESGSDKFCRACKGPRCNDALIPDKRLRCHTCKGDDCQKPTSQQCLTYREQDQCFILFDNTNSVTEMGCLSKFPSDDISELIKSKQAHICDGENCNSLENLPKPQVCTLCSSKTDINCAINPDVVKATTRCAIVPHTACYSKITEEGHTERGCHSNLEDDDFLSCYLGNSNSCSTCVGDLCNQEMFPENRAQCHACSSDSDPNCQSKPNSLKHCPVLSPEGSCVSILNGTTTVRGCRSEVECDPSDKNCRVCNGNACNVVDLVAKLDDNYGKWQELPLKCHSCEGENCKTSLGVSETCENNHEQDCLTVFNVTGEVMARGCSGKVDIAHGQYCDENPNMCFNCKSNECNIAWNLDEFVWCNYCDSAKDPSCTHPLTRPSKRRICYKSCMSALYPSAATNGTSFEVIRTCLDDKERPHQPECTETNGSCKACNSRDCNAGPYPIDRMRCNVCQNEDCTKYQSQYCPLYKKDDQCVAIYENKQISHLGCASSFHEDTILQLEAEKSIIQCSTSNCNVPTKLPKPQECVQCHSKDDPRCATQPANITTTSTCGIPEEPWCYTKITEEGHTVRGCLYDLEQAEVETCNGNTCEKCLSDTPNCNNKLVPTNRRWCYRCNSEDDENCQNSPVSNEVCPIYKESDSCVSRYENGRTERGCASDFTCDESNEKSCVICKEDSCNTHEVSSAAGLAASFAIVLLVALVNLVGIH